MHRRLANGSLHFHDPAFPISPEEMQARMMDPRMTFSEAIGLQRMDYAARVSIDEKQKLRCPQAEWRKFEDRARNQVIHELRLAVYGKDHPDRHVIRFPADWWQAVKERFAPAWFRDRWPVVFTEIGVSLKELYPDIEPVLPDQGPVMRLVKRELPVCHYDW